MSLFDTNFESFKEILEIIFFLHDMRNLPILLNPLKWLQPMMYPSLEPLAELASPKIHNKLPKH